MTTDAISVIFFNITEKENIMKQIDYPKMYTATAKRPWLIKLLSALDILAVVFTMGSFIAQLIYSFHVGGAVELAKIIAMTALPFIAVSVSRVLIKAPRPEELISFEDCGLKAPGKKGKSFPSRHVFSAMLIGTLLLGDIVWLGAIVLLLGVVLAVSRVLRGIHFIRDVIAGALIGVAAGAIGLLF